MTSSRLPTTHWKAGGKWEVCATYYVGDRWSPFVAVPDSVGRNGGEMNASADAKGNVFVALVTDHKLWGGPNFGTNPVRSKNSMPLKTRDIVRFRFEGGMTTLRVDFLVM
jgi:hypothetical protein